MTPEFIRTIKTNWRDLVAFFTLGIGLALIGGVIDYAATRYSDSTIAALFLPPLANYLQGFARFAGAAVCATFVWMILWPTVNRWSNHSFQAGWNSLSATGKFIAYTTLVSVALIAAAICFTP